jgi:predicted tellurium resistance membrane protein TerC
LRLVVIALGTELVDNFRYVNLGFAAFILFNAWQLLAGKDNEDEDLSDKWIVKACRSGAASCMCTARLLACSAKAVHEHPVLCSRLIPVSEAYDGDRFFTTAADNVRRATPLLLALAVVELSDVAFAVDSIPAVRWPITQLCTEVHMQALAHTESGAWPALLGGRQLTLCTPCVARRCLA